MPEGTSENGVKSQHGPTRTFAFAGCDNGRDRIIPTTVPSACHLSPSSDCAEYQLYERRNSAYVKAVVADALASGPFEDFLVKNDCVEARLLLNFWRDAQVHNSAEMSL